MDYSQVNLSHQSTFVARESHSDDEDMSNELLIRSVTHIEVHNWPYSLAYKDQRKNIVVFRNAFHDEKPTQ